MGKKKNIRHHCCNAWRKRRMSLILSRKRQPNANIESQTHHVIQPATSVPTFPVNKSTVIIFKSELDYISRCILDYPSIETGGQLFGFYTDAGIPVVMYAIGPGPAANHEEAFFNQDIMYLKRVGGALKERYGLLHIGEWHSHHRLGLAKPSKHDEYTMVSSIREKDMGTFLLCIGNCDDTGSTLNAFLCDDKTCYFSDWDVIGASSPVRSLVDRSLGNMLVHPYTRQARHNGTKLNPAPTRPAYAPGYWLNEKGNSVILKNIMDYVKNRNGGAAVRVRLNERGEVILSVESNKYSETILFPMGFPNSSPRVTRTSHGRIPWTVPERAWYFQNGDIYNSFIRYYDTY